MSVGFWFFMRVCFLVRIVAIRSPLFPFIFYCTKVSKREMLLIRKVLIYKVIMWAVFFLIASADTIRLSVHTIRLSADTLIVFLNSS